MNKIREFVGGAYFLIAWNAIFWYNGTSYAIGMRLGFKYTRSCEGLFIRVK